MNKSDVRCIKFLDNKSLITYLQLDLLDDFVECVEDILQNVALLETGTEYKVISVVLVHNAKL